MTMTYCVLDVVLADCEPMFTLYDKLNMYKLDTVRYKKEVLRGNVKCTCVDISKTVYSYLLYNLRNNESMTIGSGNNKRLVRTDEVRSLEILLCNNLQYSYMYSRDIIKGRFILGEDVISYDPCYSFEYAKNIVKGRFELGEDIISQDATCKLLYEQRYKITL